MVLKYDFSTLRIARSYEEHPSNPIVSMVRVRVSAVCLARAAPVLCRRSGYWCCVPAAMTLVLCPWCEYTGRPVPMVRGYWCCVHGASALAVPMVR